MKRIAILVLAAALLAALLCACSATGNIDPYGGYSNVSTTRDGTVNGTNDGHYNRYQSGAANPSGGYGGNAYGSNGAASGSYANGSGTGYGAVPGNSSGMVR